MSRIDPELEAFLRQYVPAPPAPTDPRTAMKAKLHALVRRPLHSQRHRNLRSEVKL